MGMFQDATNDQAFAKLGIFGWMGSGKTRTASKIAIGLAKLIKSDKPVYFFDTELGTAPVKAEFDREGIKLKHFRSRAFKDLLPAIQEAEKEASVLIVDSISHPWYDITASYIRKKTDGTSFIRMQDWQPIKEMWRAGFSDPYQFSKVHIIMCGRAANIFEDIEDVEASEQAGRKITKSIQTGTKMRTESDTGYEPTLLCEMEKVMLQDGGNYARHLTIVKDKYDVLDSKEFDNPTFENLLPHFKALNLGGKGANLDLKNTSDSLFDRTNDRNLAQQRKDRTVLIEEVEGTLTASYPGRSTEEVKIKTELIKQAFGGYSWSRLESLNLGMLKTGFETLKDLIKVDLAMKAATPNEAKPKKEKVA